MSNKTLTSTQTRRQLFQFLNAALCSYLLGGCVAENPLDNNPTCPCAPGWSCDETTQICTKNGSLSTGGISALGGSSGNGGLDSLGVGDTGGTGGTSIASGDTSFPSEEPSTGPCEPLVEPASAVPGNVVPGCPCTRRPGAGNSFQCPAGANASISQSIGPEGGSIVLLGQQGASSGVPFSVHVPPGAVAQATLLTITETKLPPPANFVDYSPIYHFEPDNLSLGQVVSVQIPWRSNSSTVPQDLGIYWSPLANTCGFTLLGDSSTNAGFEMASLTHAGYLFVGVPKTAVQATCP